jgi:hypothetical protein
MHFDAQLPVVGDISQRLQQVPITLPNFIFHHFYGVTD